MKDEIISGLRNAMERGESLEQATQSFVNSGYNPQEVRAAGQALSSGASGIVYAEEKTDEKDLPEMPVLPSGNEKKGVSKLPTSQPAKKGGGRKVAIVIIIILLALIFLGALGYFLYSFVL